MRTLHNLTRLVFTLALLAVSALAADPGAPYPATSEVSDQKAGSVLVYNVYTSNAAGSNSKTRASTSPTPTSQRRPLSTCSLSVPTARLQIPMSASRPLKRPASLRRTLIRAPRATFWPSPWTTSVARSISTT